MPLIQLNQIQRPSCPYCKEELSGDVYICGECNAYYHKDCFKELGNKCGTLGCSKAEIKTNIVSNKETNYLSCICYCPGYCSCNPKEDDLDKALKELRRGPELSPKLENPIKGTKPKKCRTPGVEGAVGAFLFIALCYIIMYALYGWPGWLR